MAQDTRTHSAAASAEAPSPQVQAAHSPRAASALRAGAFSADYYADSLMDELFEDVDRILEGVVPPEISQPSTDPGSELAISTESQTTAAPVNPLQSETADVSSLAIAPDSDLESTTESADLPPLLNAPPELLDNEESQPPLSLFDRLLLLAAGISVVATIVLGFMLERAWRQAQNPSAPALSTAQIAEQARKDAFLDYMQESLAAIDRRAEGQLAAAPPQVPPIANPSDVSSPETVLERVYIPVYQTPPIAPTSQPAPLPSTNTPAPSAAPAAPSTVTAAPAATYTLVGVLDLGDRSAALVNINGTTQRFQVGETIGSSGWTLVSVENQEAMIRRNGEVRSLFVGQVF